MNKLITTIFFIFINFKVMAGSCCGGGSSSSLILVGDNQQEYSLGLTYRDDLGQTDNDGWAAFHNDKTVDQQTNFNFQYQRLVTDHFQAAIKSSLVQKDITKQNRHETTSGMGDIDLQATYEFLPEYTYSAIKPRGFTYLKLTMPTSKSLYNSDSPLYSDVRGTGLYSLSAGVFFIKHISAFTVKSAIEGQHFFGKGFSTTTVEDYNKLIIPLGLSYAFDPAPISIGTGATWSYQTKKTFTGSISGMADKEYFWELNFFSNWIIDRESTLGISYSDSTLVGKNINSSLYRTVGLTYTHSTAL